MVLKGGLIELGDCIQGAFATPSAAAGGDLEALFDSTLGSAADNITYTAELQASTYGYFVLQASGNVEQQTAINLVFDGATSSEYNYWGATYSNSSVRTALAAISQTTLPVATTTVVAASDDKNNFFLECVFSIDSIITDAVNGTSTFTNFYHGLAETLKFNTWGLLGTAGEINSIALSAPTQDFNSGSRMRIWGAKV